ncbi:helix-turn-helix domain-containing protein [Streptomyces sp. NPDC051987]|uniref:nSTAND1 domain-containing NTPase n=1 Tax=Streptomyces sp. NPDC051987 TaxID=3155808 RepID=UPI00343F889B
MEPAASAPELIQTTRDFAREFTRLRTRAGLSMRALARATDVPSSTIGDYSSGRSLPLPGDMEKLRALLVKLGVTQEADLKAWTDAALRARSPVGRQRRSAPLPYRGLASFGVEDARWFHGRDDVTAELLAAVFEAQRGDLPVILVGASGSGKSSLLHAGLLAALTGPLLTCSPGDRPLAVLADRLAQVTGRPVLDPDLLRERPETVAEEVAGLGETDLTVAVDQLEEIFTLCTDEQERSAFLLALAALAAADTGSGSRVLVVLALRADFYTQALSHPFLAAALRSRQVVVRPMTTEELRQAITGPAREASIEVDDGLVPLLLADLQPGGAGAAAHDPGALPLLSHVLLTTAERSGGKRLTVPDYLASGGIQHALGNSAESVYRYLGAARQEAARRLFLRLVHLGRDTADTRRRVRWAELSDAEGAVATDVDEVLASFVAERLLTVDSTSVEITHEALLAGWPRLGEWVEANRARMLQHRRLTDSAFSWQEAGRDTGALSRGGQLALFRELAGDAGYGAPLSALEHEFLDASTAEEERVRAAGRRTVRRLWRLSVALVILLVATVALGGVAVRQRSQANSQRDQALSRQIASRGELLRRQDVSLAAGLGLEAYRISPTTEARALLLETSDTPTAVRLDRAHGVIQAVPVSSRHVLASVAADGTVRLWDVTGVRSRLLKLIRLAARTALYAAAFSPDGRQLAVAGQDGRVRRWDVTDPAHPVPLGATAAGAGTVYALAYSPDGRTLAVGASDGDLHRWRLGADGALTALLLERQEIDEAARYWENNHRLPGEYRLTGRSAERRTRWPTDSDVRLDRRQREFLKASLKAARRRRRLLVGVLSVIFTLLVTSTVFFAVARQEAEHRAQAQKAALAQQLVTVADSLGADDPRTALLLAVSGARAGASGQADTVLQHIFRTTAFDGLFTVRPVAGTEAPAVDSVSYGDDGHQLAVGTAAGGTVLIDPTRRPMQELGSVPYGHGGEVRSVSYAPTAGLLAEGGSDGTVLLVSTTDPRHRVAATLDAGPTTVGSVAWSPDSRLLAAATRNRGTLLWDVSRPEHPVPLPALPSAVGVNAVAFAPAGNLVATAGDDSRVTLWTLSRPARPTPLRLSAGATSPLDALAFSPDGTMVASGAKDGSAHLWTAGGRGHWRRVSLNGHTAAVLAVAFSPDSGMLASASADGSTALWHVDGEGAASQSSTLRGGPDAVTSVAFSPDGHTLATGSNHGEVVRWDLYRHQNAVAVPVPVRSPRPAEAVTAAAAGSTVAVTHDDGTVDLIGLGTPGAAASMRTLRTSPGDPVTAAAFGPEDAVLATGAASGRVTLSDLDPEHPHAVSHWQAGATPVRALAAAPPTAGGTSLLAVADGTTLTLWNIGDAAHPRRLSVLPAPRSPISSLAFAAGGRQLAVGDDRGDTTVWNLAAPEHPRSKGSFTLPEQAVVLSTAASSDGTRLAVAASDGKTYLLTVDAAARPHLEATLPNATTQVSFVPGTRMLVCLTTDGAPVVWDVSAPKDARPLFTVHGGTGDTKALALTTDGGTLVTIGAQGGIRAWRLSDLIPHTRLAPHACLLTGGSLSHAQWTHYAPGLPYESVCS